MTLVFVHNYPWLGHLNPLQHHYNQLQQLPHLPSAIEICMPESIYLIHIILCLWTRLQYVTNSHTLGVGKIWRDLSLSKMRLFHSLFFLAIRRPVVICLYFFHFNISWRYINKVNLIKPSLYYKSIF